MTFSALKVIRVSTRVRARQPAYVMEAKRQATLHGCAIDMPAGPRKVLVIADSNANPTKRRLSVAGRAQTRMTRECDIAYDIKKVDSYPPRRNG